MTLDGDRDRPHPSTVPALRGRYLIFGASGYIGQHLVARLLREDLPVRAVARRRAALEGRGWDRADSWSVLGVEPERRLSLKFGMKAPGAGVLEFEICRRADAQERAR